MKKRKKRRTSLYLVMMVAGLFVGTLVIHGVNLRADCKKLQAQQTEKKEIKEKSEYMKTDQYIEDTAREKFGLVYGNEIIFKAADGESGN